MATGPTASQVYNQAQAQSYSSQTPGLSAFVSAWRTLQDFTGNWAVGTYNSLQNVTNLIGELVT